MLVWMMGMFGVLATCGAQVERSALSRILIDNIMPPRFILFACVCMCVVWNASIVYSYIQYGYYNNFMLM
jgi:hypothetical protein